MKRIAFDALAVAAVLLFPLEALSHPGHGQASESVAHYVTEPIHAIPIAALVCGSIFVVGVMWVSQRAIRIFSSR